MFCPLRCQIKKGVTLRVFIGFAVFIVCRKLCNCSFPLNFRLACVNDRPVHSSHVCIVCLHHSTEEGRDELVHYLSEKQLVNKSNNFFIVTENVCRNNLSL